MIALKASEIALIVGGELHGSDVTVTAAPVFDSSQATPGSIFLALKGEKLMDTSMLLMHSPEALYLPLSQQHHPSGALLYLTYSKQLTN